MAFMGNRTLNCPPMKVDRRSNRLRNRLCGLVCAAALGAACGGTGASSQAGGAASTGGDAEKSDPLRRPEETHLRGIVQLTRGQGENAEAYWSSSGRELIFQSAREPYKCDQIFRVPADGSKPPSL